MTTPAAGTTDDEETPLVLQDLRRFLGDDRNDLQHASSLFDKSATAVPVAAIKSLVGVVQRTRAETMMGLQDELKQAADLILDKASTIPGITTRIPLQSGCELFLKYITRTFLELPDFEECKQAILERANRLEQISLAARDRIATVAADFVPHNGTVLTHGFSRVVASILLEASHTKHFDLIVLEGRPDAAGVQAAKFYTQQAKLQQPVRVGLDSAMGVLMEQVDVVLTGAEAVVESGGVVNKVGTYALACCAKASGKPFYVAAESYKFARLFALRQADIPQSLSKPFGFCDTTDEVPTKVELDEGIEVETPSVDFTPSKFITLLFTDLGVLTPSAVSDELIRLYQ